MIAIEFTPEEIDTLEYERYHRLALVIVSATLASGAQEQDADELG